ncbi:DUF1446 domain-containing protein [Sulfitobacter sp. KE34]|uniref:acyclic terpene utilization AtuA family protein n=1 Tax=unclassified Sulfitobacter TaxID=196795 RepID=UPI00144698F4|nr:MULTISPECIES: acyclic terpene utilization AtuA family protein [unclassified Sulfitobacter]NKX40255.1 DUF1446 domain-containing protein [Rhodobacteraceae bacterium R_SAG2]MDF3351626.1 DUF1446 domain-containing protein [Sulfitobacter sp. KE12]MDF3355299.1 DUF1446 domain-containing protein [Sulfitobacter sp. KE27]MDF3358947.1 DUF1446 domain-containing protein [Sulfitobacter sp. KE33]MDF3366371.1 DUF1446 domain-containing protein [Sulfitobacter sp. Ks34]
MKDVVRLGSGSGFWGDAIDPAEESLRKGKLDYLCMDYLAELTMALLQRMKMKNPEAGYIPDLIDHMRTLLPLARKSGTRIICNGGGVNPRAAGEQLRILADELGLTGLRIAVVEGDDMVERIDELVDAGEPLLNMETGEGSFGELRERVVAANVYTDSSGIRQALAEGADVVVTGRVSDNALYVGPIMHEFGWSQDAAHADLIGSAITAGHIVECASACSGGMSSCFAEMPQMGMVGFPIVEFSRDGTFVVTKPEDTGGKVNGFTVKEHLVYEIADPANYIMPDGIADFTTLTLEDLGNDRVRISGVRGKGVPEQLKLVIGYQDGWIGEGMVMFPWPRAYERAVKARQTLTERFERLGLQADDILFNFVGLDTLHGPATKDTDIPDLNEIGLRVAAKTGSRSEADKIRRACTQLWIMGPGGSAFGTPSKPRPVVAVWPTLIDHAAVTQSVTLLEV